MLDPAIKLSAILDLEQLQQLQDTFAEKTKVSTVIVDSEGQQITNSSNWKGFCGLFSASGPGSKVCKECIQQLLKQNEKTRELVMATCPHTGLTSASIPIILDHLFLGSWIFGQLRIQESYEPSLEKAAKQMQVSLEQFKQMVQDLPLITMAEFQEIYAFLKVLNRMVVQLGYSNLAAKRNIQAIIAQAEKLENNGKVLRKFIDSSDVGMYICDYHTGEILLVNQKYCQQVGLGQEQVIGKKCWIINGLGEETFCTNCPRHWLLDAQNKPTEPYSWRYYNRKYHRWLHCTNQVIQWVDGRMAQMVTSRDITEEQNMREQLSRMVFYDRDTALPNSEKLSQDLKAAKNYFNMQEQFLVCFFLTSLQDFCLFYGRDMGNELLRTIVAWLKNQRYSNSTLYRTEGYGLCLMLQNSDLKEAQSIAQSIRNRFSDPWTLNIFGAEISCFCRHSLSIISLNESMRNTDVQNLMDCTLRQAQQKSQEIFIYDDEVQQKDREKQQFSRSLKNAIKQGMEGFEIHYQPIVCLRTGTWKGLEALCRWTSSTKGQVSPGVFIPEAEKLGLINHLGAWVLETAIQQCKELHLDTTVEGFFLSVNISAVQIMDEKFVCRVEQILQRYDFPGDKLNLEVTKSADMAFNDFALSTMDRLRQFGVKMADCNTGHFSLNQIKDLPMNFLKIGRASMDIEGGSHLRYYFNVMAEIAHAQNMHLIAERIETREQLEIIKNNGADFIQGNYFSRPLPKEELGKRLRYFTQVDPKRFNQDAELIGRGQWLSEKTADSVPTAFQKDGMAGVF